MSEKLMQVYQAVERSLFQKRFRALLGIFLFALAASGSYGQSASPAQAPKTPPTLGTIQSITTDSVTVKTDAGADVKVQIPAGVKVLQVPPESKDLKQATPIQLTDLQPGDRVLISTKPGDDPATQVAVRIVAMKKTDLAFKHEKEATDWQRRGIGGLVSAVDPAQNTITIKTLTAAGSKEIVIHAGQNTVLRRYAPGSINFDEAKVAPITEVHVGDQLRARGTRSADGAEFTAEEIVSGSFKNIAGIVTAVNASTGTLTLNDLASKKPVELKVTPESQMRKLPQQLATGIAMRLKNPDAGGASPAGPGGQAGGSPQTQAGAAPAQGAAGAAGAPGANGAGGGPRRAGDIQQLLSHLPASPITDFAKGDAVMVVATSSQGDGPSTVITLLGGVEPILQATSQGQAASILSPWSLGQGGGGDAGTP
jgi:hypothetical protein